MTLFDISLRNAKRQARDYLVYFATIVMAAALLYAFNGLVFSQEIRFLSKNMKSIPLVIFLASIVVVCVFGWLVSYATRFMLSRRGRELGIYILTGLTNRQVSRLFFLENLAVGGAALISGMALGVLFYQFLRAILLTMFGVPYHLSLAVSLPAAGLTAAYFALIYLYALRKSRKSIQKMKIHDLIYMDRQNEGAVIQAGKKRRRIFAASVVLGVIGTLLLTAGNTGLGIIGAGCVIAFLFGFFTSFASGVPAFFDKRPALKYQGQTLLIFRTLTAKLATMGIVMATISMIFTGTVASEGAGLVLRGLVNGRAAEDACFDLYIGMDSGAEEQDEKIYLDYISENILTEQTVFYQIYRNNSTQVRDYITGNTVYYYYGDEEDLILRWSDYAALREIAGYPPVSPPEPGQYLFHCTVYLEETLRAYAQTVSVGAYTLSPGGVHTEHLSQRYDSANGRGYILVVPDEAAEGLPTDHLACATKTSEPVTEAQYDALECLAEEEFERRGHYDLITAKAHEETEVAMQTAIFVFPLFYIALALAMTAAAILTIQQLSETERYKRQFALLRKLGMDKKEMSKALRGQFAVYYAMPAVPPVLIGAPFIHSFASIPEPGVMVGWSRPWVIVAVAMAAFGVIYAVYVLLAYSSLKRGVLPE